MEKIIYNKNLLDKICNRDKFTLLDNNIDKLTCRTRIDFICNCGNNYNKSFKQLNDVGGYCKKCTFNNMGKKLQLYSQSSYNKEYLETLQKRDNFIITDNDIPYYSKQIYINFTCSCGINYKKSYKQIEKSGGFCKECTKIKAYERCHATNIEKYGVKWSLQSKEVRDKGKETWGKTLGVSHPLKCKKVQEKKKETCLEKYGVEHQFNLQEVQDKCKNTMLDKYNTTNVMLLDEIKNKYKDTCMSKFGVEYAMQNSKISEKQLKNCYNLKSFTFSCGNIVQVQGYEPFLLDILVKDGYTFSDIIVDRSLVPEIWYININNKKCRYFCDVFIPKTNTIYEVKSTWTYDKDTENIMLKKQACIDKGYNFELYVFDAKHNRIII
jgi:hypothetical protein